MIATVTIGAETEPGEFLGNLRHDVRRQAIDWPPQPRPLQTYTVGPVLEAFLAAQRDGRRLELCQIDGHPVVREVMDPEVPPPFLRLAGAGR